MIFQTAAAIFSVSAAGTYLWFRGERILDGLIEYQKRRRGGFYKTIKVNGWCNACGHRNGEISWNPEVERVMHTCNVCGASWPELPRVPAHAWDYLGKMIKERRDNAEDVKEVFARANTPIKPSKDQAKEKVQ
jgi:hypothetical protein